MTDLELDEILTLHWPGIVRQVMADGSDEWLKGFVRSIARHGKRAGWHPTDRQAAIMRRLVVERGQPVHGDPRLIESEHEGGFSTA